MKKAILVWIILCVIWGSTWIFIKLGLRDLPPITFAGTRFLIAAAILSLIVLIRKRKLPRTGNEWLLVAWTGFIAIGLNYGLIFWGEQHINSGLAAVIQATIPAFGLIIAHYYIPNERITARRAGGVIIGILGVSVIFYDQMRFEGSMALWGCLALTASSICVAYANVIIKARCRGIDPTTLASSQMIIGAVLLLSLGIFLEGNPMNIEWTGLALVSLTYLSLAGSALAFILYYWLLTQIEVTKTMLIALVTPVIALLIGVIVLNEKVSWRIASGSMAILIGISLILFRRRVRI